MYMCFKNDFFFNGLFINNDYVCYIQEILIIINCLFNYLFLLSILYLDLEIMFMLFGIL